MNKYYPESIPEPKDLKRHFFEDYDLNELFNNLNEDLFHSRFLKLKKTDLRKVEETKKIVDEIKEDIVQNKIIKPKGVCKFFKINSENDKVVFFEGSDVVETIDFPRQTAGDKLSVADFIAPLSGEKRDFIALFIVSCGEGIKEFSKAERDKGNYLKSYIIEALSLSLTEAFAEILHYKIRENWGFKESDLGELGRVSGYKGKRYSFGFPSCPDLSNQRKIFNLLKPEKDINIKLTDSFMMEPEASVSAFALHNPKAKYFAV